MLELKNINYSVSQNGEKKRILNNINLQFEDGNIFVVTGANGSGKSTLAKIIMGIIKPDSGQILLDGKDITNLSITERANLGISFAFQNTLKFKGITVKDILENSTKHPINISEGCKYLADVGLCARDYLKRELDNSLSGGELRRIEIATAISRSSHITIFDEPEAGIDVWSFEKLIKIFEKNKKANSINIIISHQEKIFNIADKIILLDNGEIVKNVEEYSLFKNSYLGCSKLKGGKK